MHAEYEKFHAGLATSMKNAMKDTALITNIQRFSLDDGDGIRTTVFFKGCPLRCLWCHNPECISPAPDIQFDAAKCTGCGACMRVCPKEAIKVTDPKAIHATGQSAAIPASGPKEAIQASGPRAGIDRSMCDGCGLCAQSCKSCALEQIGRYYSAAELQQELLKDLMFFKNSRGGVTLSGGEPLSQSAFLTRLLPLLKKEDVHIAVDTCGFFSQTEYLTEILKQTDLILFDIKAMDPVLHKQLTGNGNAKILSNFDLLCGLKIPVRVRVPLIAGLNDSEDELTKIADLVNEKPAVKLVELLPYHAYGTSKYEMLGLEYSGNEYAPPSAKRLQELAKLFKTRNIPVRIMEH